MCYIMWHEHIKTDLSQIDFIAMLFYSELLQFIFLISCACVWSFSIGL